jgi:hypothetical protein
MDRCPPLSWRAVIGHFPLIRFEVVSMGVETDSGRSLLMGGGLDRCDWDPLRVQHAHRDLGRSAGAFSVRMLCTTVRRVLPMTADTAATFMDRVAAAVSPQRVTHDGGGLSGPVQGSGADSGPVSSGCGVHVPAAYSRKACRRIQPSVVPSRRARARAAR